MKTRRILAVLCIALVSVFVIAGCSFGFNKNSQKITEEEAKEIAAGEVDGIEVEDIFGCRLIEIDDDMVYEIKFNIDNIEYFVYVNEEDGDVILIESEPVEAKNQTEGTDKILSKVEIKKSVMKEIKDLEEDEICECIYINEFENEQASYMVLAVHDDSVYQVCVDAKTGAIISNDKMNIDDMDD